MVNELQWRFEKLWCEQAYKIPLVQPATKQTHLPPGYDDLTGEKFRKQLYSSSEMISIIATFVKHC